MNLHRSALSILTCLTVFFLAACQAAPVATLLPTAAAPAVQPSPIAILIDPAATDDLPSPTPAPTTAATEPISLYPPTPTIVPNLLARVPAELIPPPPDGLAMELYKMAEPPFPDEGYGPVLRALGEQSRVSKLTQGRYFWDTADLALMEADNAALAPFGYRLESKPVEPDTGSRWFTLYQGEKIVLDPIYSLSQVSVNRSGTDFMMVVEATNDLGLGDFQLVRKASIEPWKFTLPWHPVSRPQFLGDEVMHVEIPQTPPATEAPTFVPQDMIINVFRGDKLIDSVHHQDQGAAPTYIGFWTYGEHWALETADHVVIDGKDLDKLNGYDKTYEFHLLGGKPLFFFEKAGTLGVSFDGKTSTLPFPAIPHYGCCSAGANNPLQIGDILIFYGERGGSWFYVEMAGKDYNGP